MYGGADAGVPRVYTGVYRVCTRCFTAFYGVKRPDPTFYVFTAPLFTPFCAVLRSVLRCMLPHVLLFISVPAATQGTLTWLR